MSFYSVAAFIRDNYPQYFGYQTYPIADCVRIRKVAEEWGVFCNFYATPIVVDGVAFKNAEQVFQLMNSRIRRLSGGYGTGLPPTARSAMRSSARSRATKRRIAVPIGAR